VADAAIRWGAFGLSVRFRLLATNGTAQQAIQSGANDRNRLRTWQQRAIEFRVSNEKQPFTRKGCLSVSGQERKLDEFGRSV
jgi:hypothetical protein